MSLHDDFSLSSQHTQSPYLSDNHSISSIESLQQDESPPMKLNLQQKIIKDMENPHVFQNFPSITQNTTRIYFQNHEGIKSHDNFIEWADSVKFLNDNNVSIFGAAETSLPPTKQNHKKLCRITRKGHDHIW